MDRNSGTRSEAGCWKAVHRAGQFLGERVHRVVQREAPGRTDETGDLLHAKGNHHPDRANMARRSAANAKPKGPEEKPY